TLSCTVLFKGWHHNPEWHWLGFGCGHPSISRAFGAVCRIPQTIFVSSQAQEIPSILLGKTGDSCEVTSRKCRSTLEKLVKWQQPGSRFSLKTSPLRTNGLCDQNGPNGRRFEVLAAIRSSFEQNCWVWLPCSAATHLAHKSSPG